MKTKLKKFNYENHQYLQMFQDTNLDFYQKYVSCVKKYLDHKDKSFLDIGCGNGNAIISLLQKKCHNLFGCEISSLFVQAAKKRGLKSIVKYNGYHLPYPNNHFNVVGSFGVLEHATDPINFLSEHIRVTKNNGYIIVTCPNFLTVFFKLCHPRVDSFSKRLQNIPKIIKKLINKEVSFEKTLPIIRKKFHADDDMVTISNLIDIERFFQQNHCRIIHSDGIMLHNNRLLDFIGSIFLFRYLLPSCFIIVQKLP